MPRAAEAGVALIVAVLATTLVGDGVVAALVIVTSADIFIPRRTSVPRTKRSMPRSRVRTIAGGGS